MVCNIAMTVGRLLNLARKVTVCQPICGPLEKQLGLYCTLSVSTVPTSTVRPPRE